MSARTKNFVQGWEWQGTERCQSGGAMAFSMELGHGLELVSYCENLRAWKPTLALDANL